MSPGAVQHFGVVVAVDEAREDDPVGAAQFCVEGTGGFDTAAGADIGNNTVLDHQGAVFDGSQITIRDHGAAPNYRSHHTSPYCPLYLVG